MDLNTLIIVFFGIGIFELAFGLFIKDEGILKQFKKEVREIRDEKSFIKYQRFLFVFSGVVIMIVALLLKFKIIPELYVIGVYVAYFIIEIVLSMVIKKKFL